jgi:hypothetical protein
MVIETLTVQKSHNTTKTLMIFTRAFIMLVVYPACDVNPSGDHMIILCQILRNGIHKNILLHSNHVGTVYALYFTMLL